MVGLFKPRYSGSADDGHDLRACRPVRFSRASHFTSPYHSLSHASKDNAKEE